MAKKYTGWTPTGANANLDLLPQCIPTGRSVGSFPIYVANNAVFNPLDYLAVGNDPTHDDAAALQNCLNAAAGVGPVVLRRMFYVSSTVSIPANTVMVGEGRHTGIKRRKGTVILGSSGRVIASAGFATFNPAVAGPANITLSNFLLSQQTEGVGGNTRPALGRDYAVASFYGVDGLVITDVTVDEPLHFGIDCDTCDNITIKGHTHKGQYASTPVGNCDGVHFACCRDFNLDTAQIDSGDDMVGVTTVAPADGGRTSYRGRIVNIRGSSKEANGVIFNSESLSGSAIFEMEVDNVHFHSAGSPTTGLAVRFKGDAAAPGTFNIICGQAVVSNVIGRFCAGALSLVYAQEIEATNIRSSNTTNHSIFVDGSKNIVLSNLGTRGAGGGSANDINGLNITGSSNIVVNGSMHVNDGLYGCQVIGSTDVGLNGVVAIGCGIEATTPATTAGIRVHDSTRVAVGATCRAKDDGGGYTKYGLLIDGVCTDVVVHADPSQFGGVTKQILNNANAGVYFQPGGPLAWVEFNTVAGAVTYDATTAKNVTGLIRHADGDYSLTMGISFSTNDAIVVAGSASDGNTATTLVVKVKSVAATAAGGTVRIAVTNGAGALVQPTKVYVSIAGRIGSVP